MVYLGNQVKKFESDYSNFCGTNYCVGVASGLDALVIALDKGDKEAIEAIKNELELFLKFNK